MKIRTSPSPWRSRATHAPGLVAQVAALMCMTTWQGFWFRLNQGGVPRMSCLGYLL